MSFGKCPRSEAKKLLIRQTFEDRIEEQEGSEDDTKSLAVKASDAEDESGLSTGSGTPPTPDYTQRLLLLNSET